MVSGHCQAPEEEVQEQQDAGSDVERALQEIFYSCMDSRVWPVNSWNR